MTSAPTTPKKSQMPLRPGSPVVSRSVSPSEREFITSILPNWQEGQALPSNWRDLVATAKQIAIENATNARKIPLPIDPTTPPQVLKTLPIESLSPDLQREYRAQFDELGEALQGFAAQAQAEHAQNEAAKQLTSGITNPVVAAAVQHAAGPTIDVADEPTPEKEDPRQPGPQQEVTKSGRPLPPWLIITDADRDQYVVSATTGAPFTKRGSLLNRRVDILFRSMTREELNAIDEYVTSQRKLKTDAELSDEVLSFQAMFQIAMLTFKAPGATNYQAPKSLEAFAAVAGNSLPEMATWFRVSVAGNQTFWRALNTAANRFSQFLDRLEEEGASPDFTEPHSDAS